MYKMIGFLILLCHERAGLALFMVFLYSGGFYNGSEEKRLKGDSDIFDGDSL